MTQTATEMDPIQALKKLRVRRKWTQEDLAKRIEVPVRTIRAWEQGKTIPKTITLAGIRDFVRRHK